MNRKILVAERRHESTQKLKRTLDFIWGFLSYKDKQMPDHICNRLIKINCDYGSDRLEKSGLASICSPQGFRSKAH